MLGSRSFGVVTTPSSAVTTTMAKDLAEFLGDVGDAARGRYLDLLAYRRADMRRPIQGAAVPSDAV